MSNPINVNSIYYATDNPTKPKSYNVGIKVRRSNKKRGDLMIIQGPLYPAFKKERILGLRMEGVNINGRPPKTKRDIDLWVNTNVHVTGKNDWIFIKTHTHGATDSDAVLGNEMVII